MLRASHRRRQECKARLEQLGQGLLAFALGSSPSVRGHMFTCQCVVCEKLHVSIPRLRPAFVQNVYFVVFLRGSRVARRAQGQPDLPDAGIAVVEKDGSDQVDLARLGVFCGRSIERRR